MRAPTNQQTAERTRIAGLVEGALARGRAELEAGHQTEALRWLERARRLAPADGTIALLLGSAAIGVDNVKAAGLFTEVLASADVSEAWRGLATARFLAGDFFAARAALDDVLSRHVSTPDIAGLAGQVARATGAPGWCRVTSNGVLVIHALGPMTGQARIVARIDGRPIPDAEVPQHPSCRAPGHSTQYGIVIPTRSATWSEKGPDEQWADIALPPGWPRARQITVTAGQRHLIGSPISPGAIRRIDGFVEAWEGGVRGWAWCPGDPDVTPRLSIGIGRTRIDLLATEPTAGIPGLAPLARPRSFAISWADLPSRSGPVHLRGDDGRNLLGSPVVRFWPDAVGAPNLRRSGRPASIRPPDGVSSSGDHVASPYSRDLPRRIVVKDSPDNSPIRSREGRDGLTPAIWTRRKLPRDPAPERKLAILIGPGEGSDLGPCIESILDSAESDARIILLDHPDERPVRGSRRLHERVMRLRGDIEAGIAACPDHDVVLLESGVLVPPGWLGVLRKAAYGAADIGTVTPFSNRGAVAYPTPEGCDLAWLSSGPGVSRSGQPDERPAVEPWSMTTIGMTAEIGRHTTISLDRLARRANRGNLVAIPVGGGPCMFIRGDCLAAVGPIRSRLFAQGNGAREDFCARANDAGWRNIGLPGLFVGVRDPDSQGDDAKPTRSSAAWDQLQARNTALLERLHPRFRDDSGRSADLLRPSRRRLDLERWRANGPVSAILVTHADGGGVERRVATAVALHQAKGHRAVVLRPHKLPNGAAGLKVDGASFPNLWFELPREQPALLRLLRAARPLEAEFHHFLNHHPSIFEIIPSLHIPYDAHAHDYTWFCPRIALVGRGDRYCGEPAQTVCEACVAELGNYLHENISVAYLRDRSRKFLDGARRVIAPSRDAADRLPNHFPGLSVTACPHEDDDAINDPPPIVRADGPVRVCVAGAIGLHKGYDILLACALDARQRGLDLTFVVAGTTIDDQRLMETGRIFVTGPYQPAEAVALIRAQNAALALLPSIWPETWCLGLTELWRAGLRVAAFDIGAPAERIRRTGRGFLIPLGLSAAAINDTLLRYATGRSLLPIRHSSAYKAPR